MPRCRRHFFVFVFFSSQYLSLCPDAAGVSFYNFCISLCTFAAGVSFFFVQKEKEEHLSTCPDADGVYLFFLFLSPCPVAAGLFFLFCVAPPFPPLPAPSAASSAPLSFTPWVKLFFTMLISAFVELSFDQPLASRPQVSPCTLFSLPSTSVQP